MSSLYGELEHPLRPCAEDLGRMWHAIGPLHKPRVLVLGVTPSLITRLWGSGIGETVCLDRSAEQIRRLWPDSAVGHAWVTQGNWLDMPFGDATFDAVITDDGVNWVVGREIDRLAAQVRRVLRPNGVFVHRVLEWPDPLPDTPARSMIEFRMRFVMACQGDDFEGGVRLGDVWTAYQTAFPDRDETAKLFGCSRATVDAIDWYRDNDQRFSFLPEQMLADRFAEHGFVTERQPVCSYAFAEHWPILALR